MARGKPQHTGSPGPLWDFPYEEANVKSEKPRPWSGPGWEKGEGRPCLDNPGTPPTSPGKHSQVGRSGHPSEGAGAGADGRREALRFRPHHLFCTCFLPLENLVRGEGFSRTVRLIRDLVRHGEGVELELHEGPDSLCESCPEFKDGRCSSPAGDEEKVRKWDRKVLEGLGLSFGQKVRVDEFRGLIREKAPLEFCRSRCPWRSACGVFRERGLEAMR